MPTLKKVCFLHLLSLLLLLHVTGCRGGEVEDPGKVVITVGERDITSSEYNRALKLLVPADILDSGGEELMTLKRDAAAQLVEEALILAEALRLNLTVSEDELAEEIDEIRRDAGDDNLTGEVSSRYGNLEEWKKEIRKRLLVKKVVDAVVGSGVEVTEDALRGYYREHASEYEVPEQVHARMIVTGAEDEARRIKGGLTAENFSTVARKTSLSPEAETGGDLGFFGRGDMPREFEDVVFKLRPGEISDIVKTEYGYHIFFLEKKRTGGRLAYEEVKDEINKKLRDEEFEKRFDSWITSLMEKTPIEVKEDLL